MRGVAQQTQAPQGAAAVRGTGLVSGDQILVTLTAEKPGGERVSISNVFDSQGQQIDNSGKLIGGRSLDFGTTPKGTEPVFPQDAYAQALKDAQASGKNDGTADRIIASYKDQMEEYANQGGAPATERLGGAIFRFLEQEHGVKSTDHAGLILKPEDVQVRAPARRNAEEPGVWLVQLTPTWGF